MKETPRGCKSSVHTLGPASDAPVAYVVTRDDERVAICTACLRQGDDIVEIVASFEMNGKHYLEHDLVGGIMLTAAIITAMNAVKGKTKH